MTSACGVVGKCLANGGVNDTFVYQNLRARGDIFDEFFYDPKSLHVRKLQVSDKSFTIGSTLPLEGKSYSYPNHFDILVLRDGVAIKVRNGAVATMLPLADYQVGAYPIVNGRGFLIRIDTQSELAIFLQEYAKITPETESGFMQKYMDFDTYRRVTIS